MQVIQSMVLVERGKNAYSVVVMMICEVVVMIVALSL